jgi:hypothetical protein
MKRRAVRAVARTHNQAPLDDALKRSVERIRPDQARQIEDALKIVSPVRERRNECKAKLVLALEYVDWYRTAVYDKRSPAARKKQYNRLAKALERVVTAAKGQQLPDPFLSDVQHYAEEYGQAADRIVVRSRDTRKPDRAKQATARRARALLRDFDRPASRTHNGSWHRLANILYDKDGSADLFEYLAE